MATRFKVVEQHPRFVISNDIPLAPSSAGRKGGTGAEAIYPFDQMRVGASFEVLVAEYAGRNRGKVKIGQIQSALGNCARGYAKRHNPKAKFVTRQIDGVAVRVWRVA